MIHRERPVLKHFGSSVLRYPGTLGCMLTLVWLVWGMDNSSTLPWNAQGFANFGVGRREPNALCGIIEAQGSIGFPSTHGEVIEATQVRYPERRRSQRPRGLDIPSRGQNGLLSCLC